MSETIAGGRAGHAALALALLERRRAALEERIALAAHDRVAADDVAFADVRAVAGAAVDAIAAALRGDEEPAVSLRLHRAASCALDRGVSLRGLVSAVLAANVAVVDLVADEEPAAASPAARGAGAVAADVLAAAARALDEQARAVLRRRAERTERFRRAAGEIAAASLEPDRVVEALLEAVCEVAGNDWAAVARPDDSGGLGIAGVRGRGTAWAARWRLRDDAGFPAQVLRGREVVVTADPEQIPYDGADAPGSVVAAPLLAADGSSLGLIFGGRDHASLPDEEDAGLIGAIGAVGGRALAAALGAGTARRAGGVVEALGEVATLALEDDAGAALNAVARAACVAGGADVAVVRVARDGGLVVEGVHAGSASLAAELAGLRTELADVGGVDDPLVRRTQERLGAEAVRAAVALEHGAGEIVLVRSSAPAFAHGEIELVDVAAAHATLALRLQRGPARDEAGHSSVAEGALELAAAADEASLARAVEAIAGALADEAGDAPAAFLPVAALAGAPALRTALRGGEDDAAALARLEPLAARIDAAARRVRAGSEREGELRRLSAIVDVALRADGRGAVVPTLAALGAHVAALVPGARPVVLAVEDERLVHAEPAAALDGPVAAAALALLRAEHDADLIVVPSPADDDRLASVADLADEPLAVLRLRVGGADLGAVALPGVERPPEGALRRHAPALALALRTALRAADAARGDADLERALRAEGELRAELAAQEAVARSASADVGWPRIAQVVAEHAAALAHADAACVLAGDPARGLELVAAHVAAPGLRDPILRVLGRERLRVPPTAIAPLAAGRPVVLDGAALADGGLLGPLRAPGATVGLVPVPGAGAVLAAVSLDPERPLGMERLERLERLALQAGLASRG